MPASRYWIQDIEHNFRNNLQRGGGYAAGEVPDEAPGPAALLPVYGSGGAYSWGADPTGPGRRSETGSAAVVPPTRRLQVLAANATRRARESVRHRRQLQFPLQKPVGLRAYHLRRVARPPAALLRQLRTCGALLSLRGITTGIFLSI